MVKISFNGARATVTDGSKELDFKLKELLSWVDKKLERAAYYQKWSPPNPKRSCYDPKTKSFPTGLLPRVTGFLDDILVKYELEQVYKWEPHTPWELPEWAWDHQRLVVKTALDHQRLMVSSPTASGKSKSMCWTIMQYPTQKVLVTVPQKELMYSLTRQLAEFTDEPIGQVGDGKSNWQRVTIGIMNSLSIHAAGKFAGELEKVQVLLGDECHTGACDMFINISNACVNTFFRIGVSATAFREDGADLVLEGVFGSLALKIPEMEMVGKGVSHKPEVRFVKVPAPDVIYSTAVIKKGKPEYPEGKPNQREVLLAAICQYQLRNELIVEIVKKYLEFNERSQVLILVTEIENHGTPLQQIFADKGLEIPFVHSKLTPVSERKKLVEQFSNCDIRVLLSSPALNVGVDFPSVGLTINAAAGSGKIGITQKTGRGVRADKSGRKTRAVQVDFWDEEPYFYNNQARKRLAHLNSLYPECSKVVTVEELYDEFKLGRDTSSS